VTQRVAGGGGGGSAGSPLAVLATAALLSVLAYALIYPWRGFSVPIGLDTPVYLWSSRHAAVFGLDAPGLLGRPGAFGTIATLFELLPTSDLTVVAAVQPAVIVTAALASAAFVAAKFGARIGLVAMITVGVALFLTPLADGYIAAAMFLASFTAGLAMLVRSCDESWRTSAMAGSLFAAGALSHPLFAMMGLPIVGAVLGVAVSARRAIPSWRCVTRRAGFALAIALPLTFGLLFLSDPDGTPLDTSGDAAFRRLGATSATIIFRRHQLLDQLPAFLFLSLAALLVVDRTLRESDRAGDWIARATVFWGAVAGWIVVTVAGGLALAGGVPVPAHRLLWVCLPPIFVIGVAADRFVPPSGWGLADRWGRVLRWVAVSSVVATLLVVHAIDWRGAEPAITTPEAEVLARLGAGLEMRPGASGLVLLSGDAVPVTELIDEVNWLRASVPPGRLHDVWAFPGDPESLYGGGPEPIGARFYDRVIDDYDVDARSRLDEVPVIVAAGPIDPEATDEAQKVDGARPFGEDVVLLPASPGGSAATLADPGAVRLMVPWSVPLWAPVLVALFGLVGFGWVRWSMPRRALVERVALAPAAGLAALVLASLLVDLAGIRLNGVGAVVAAAVATVPGVLLGGITGVLSGRASRAERTGG
jgi:hypothetical protein